MPLGQASLQRLRTCHSELQRLVKEVSRGIDEGDLSYAGVTDMTVLCGYRGKAEQDAAVASGASKAPWPRSAHNKIPAQAVDVAPFPLDWGDTRAFDALHAYTAGVAHALGIDLKDISWDRPHIERTAHVG